MTFALNPRRPVGAEARRLLKRQLHRIERHLAGRAPVQRRIHETRKRIKEARGLLRIVRYSLGDHFAIENVWYRDAAREFSAARDAEAALEAITALRDHAADDATRRAIVRVRRAVRKRARNVADHQAHIDHLLAELPAARARIQTWPRMDNAFSSLHDGLERTFRDAKRALDIAETDRSPQNFHELRKRVKDHWYEAQLVEKAWPAMLDSYTHLIADLSRLLGLHHDLVMLRQLLSAEPESFGSPATIEKTCAAIGEWLPEIEQRALRLAAPIYAEKPAQWRRRIGGYWEIARRTL